jgi:hypothetical protein
MPARPVANSGIERPASQGRPMQRREVEAADLPASIPTALASAPAPAMPPAALPAASPVPAPVSSSGVATASGADPGSAEVSSTLPSRRSATTPTDAPAAMTTPLPDPALPNPALPGADNLAAASAMVAPPRGGEAIPIPASRPSRAEASSATTDTGTVSAAGHSVASAAGPGLSPQIAAALNSRMNHGRAGIVVQLQPEHLGEVTIHLSGHGADATLRITVEKPETLQLLQQDHAQLRAAIAPLTGTGGEPTLQLNLASDGQGGDSGRYVPPERPAPTGTFPDRPAAPTGVSAAQPSAASARGGIDITA